MNVLVTGSRGMIGREICKQLREKGHQVKEYSKENGFDVMDSKKLEEEAKGCRAIIHLAAVIEESHKDMYSVNTQGTRNALEAGMKARAERFLLMSTTGVYGNTKQIATEETPLNPETGYEKSKAEAERIAQEYQETTQITIIRSALAIGPNEYWKKIVKMIAKGFPIIGSGKNKWQIIYYKDVASATAFLLENPKAEGETYNVAEEKGETLEGLVGLFREELDTATPKHMAEWKAMLLATINSAISRAMGRKTVLRPEYVKRLLRNRDYSTEKIRVLGWKPKYTTIKAVRETIKELGTR